ncbi:MAG TPA: N-acetyltransferase [Candidatus Nitrosotenuis sp.]|nr:N-acetyltransferase [Candidatus Nitrosotenuis sp.]
MIALAACAIRPAHPADLPAIHALVAEHARRGQLLPRTPESLRRHLEDWRLAVHQGRLLGVGALHKMAPDLAEIRSLAVDPSGRGQGIGRRLVEALVELGRSRGLGRIFALTREVEFFRRCGFVVVERSLFPEKIWLDCLACPLRHRCDEVAVMLPEKP